MQQNGQCNTQTMLISTQNKLQHKVCGRETLGKVEKEDEEGM
jgi:hypothetical protein